jgi:hypothetical protein
MKSDIPADGKMKLFSLSVKNAVGYFSSLNYIIKFENYTDFTFTKKIKNAINLGNSLNHSENHLSSHLIWKIHDKI